MVAPPTVFSPCVSVRNCRKRSSSPYSFYTVSRSNQLICDAHLPQWIRSDSRGPGRANERERWSWPSGRPSTTAPNRRQPSGTPNAPASSCLTSEGAEEARPEPGLHRAEKHDHHAEGGVPVPVGHRPPRSAPGRVRDPPCPLRRSERCRRPGTRRRATPQEPRRRPSARAILRDRHASSVVASPVGIGLLRAHQRHPGRPAGVPCRRARAARHREAGRRGPLPSARRRSCAPWRGGGWPRGAP